MNEKVIKGLSLTLVSFLFLTSGLLLAQSHKEKVLKYLQKEMKEQKIPGLQVAVVRNNETILSEALGLANVPFSVEVTKNTIFSINSIAKAFTATAIMQLVENDTLQISAPISNYLEELPQNWGQLTIQQLLSHTSGLPDIEDPITGGLIGGKGQDSAWAKVKKMPLQFNAGEAFNYNATNYLLLQKLVEKFSKNSFEEIIQKKQFDVAGMNKTMFGNSFDVMKNKSPTYSYYYQDKVTGEYSKGNQLLELNEEFPTMLRADAGAFATAEDMAKWIVALQTGRFLKEKKHITSMWTPVKLNNGTYDGFGGILNAYALGWPVIDRKSHPAVALIGGGRASFFIYPKDDLAIVLFTNLSGSSPHEIIDKLSKFYLSN
ncbi:MAG: serine hydrolase domain-containing protein [Saonia sp.]